MARLYSKLISLSMIKSHRDSGGMGRRNIDGSPKARLEGVQCGSGAITLGFGNYVRLIYLILCFVT